MKDAIGGSLLLNIVVIFTSIIILFFVTMLTYTKAYKIKNRIIEVIEKNEKYDSVTKTELNSDLHRAGYVTATKDQIDKKCEKGNLNSLQSGETGYLYCVYCKDYDNQTGKCAQETTYEVVTYIHFNLPVIGNMMTFAVKGETKTLGRVYDY